MSIVEHKWHSKDEMPLPDIKVICQTQPLYEGDPDTEFIAYVTKCTCKRSFRDPDDPEYCDELVWRNVPDYIDPNFKWRYK